MDAQTDGKYFRLPTPSFFFSTIPSNRQTFCNPVASFDFTLHVFTVYSNNFTTTQSVVVEIQKYKLTIATVVLSCIRIASNPDPCSKRGQHRLLDHNHKFERTTTTRMTDIV